MSRYLDYVNECGWCDKVGTKVQRSINSAVDGANACCEKFASVATNAVSAISRSLVGADKQNTYVSRFEKIRSYEVKNGY